MLQLVSVLVERRGRRSARLQLLTVLHTRPTEKHHNFIVRLMFMSLDKKHNNLMIKVDQTAGPETMSYGIVVLGRPKSQHLTP